MRIMLEENLSTCKTMEEVLYQTQSTLQELRDDGFPIVYVAGPISADGEEHIQRNIDRLLKARTKLVHLMGNRALSFTAPFIFTPEVYERLGVFDMNRDEREASLQQFWDTLIQSGVIDGIYFTPGWERSPGAQRERATADHVGVPIYDLPADL